MLSAKSPRASDCEPGARKKTENAPSFPVAAVAARPRWMLPKAPERGPYEARSLARTGG
jgi:hypothetical protein